MVMCAATFASPVAAAELLPPDRPIPEVIDTVINQRLTADKVVPAQPAKP